MPVFGIKAPSGPELLLNAAEFCRRNGLHFLEADPLTAAHGELWGLELLPPGNALSFKLTEPQEMADFLASLPPRQPVLLEAESREELEALTLWVNNWLNRQSAAGELWDVYDENRRPTGRLHHRGESLKPGDYHLVVHVWIRDSLGRYLLTRRSSNKGYGGLWESPGGAAQAGDDSLSACLREIHEETGLTLEPEQGRVVESYRGDHYFCDVWLFKQDFSLEDVVLQAGETCDCRYAFREEVLELHRQGLFVPFEHLEKILDAK